MTTLDQPTNYPDPTEVSFIPTGVRYGLIGGLILIIYGFLGNTLGFGRPSAGLVALTLFGLSFFIIYIGLLYFTIRKHRDDDLGGYITLGRAVMVGVTAAIVAGVLSTLYNYVYITMIDPAMITEVMEETQVMFEELGLPEDQIDEQMAAMEDRMNPTQQLTSGLLTSAGFGAIVSLIIGAIVKKSPEA